MDTVLQNFSRIAPSLVLEFAWPMLWQSSVLIVVLFLIDLFLSRRLRASVRYSLWLVLLVKLVLPPSLACPSSPAWWIRPATMTSSPPIATVIISQGASRIGEVAQEAAITGKHPASAPFGTQAWLLLTCSLVSLGLFCWMLARWRQVVISTRQAMPAPAQFEQLLQEARNSLRSKRAICLKLSQEAGSPSVSGFIRPVILLPLELADRLSPGQLRTIILHELIHLRRGDIWINCGQTLLQILYWWHPLLWLANLRIRRLREEAVDDEVMYALNEEADHYPVTLLEVAKLTLHKSLSSLALVGILEARHALRQRIKRLVDFPRPRKAGLTLASVFSVLAFGAVALPMGQAPLEPAVTRSSAAGDIGTWPDPRFPGYAQVSLYARFLIVDSFSLELFLPSLAGAQAPLVVSSNEVADLEKKLGKANAQAFPRGEALAFGQFSGGRFHYRVGGVTNNLVDYQTRTRADGSTVVIGAECSYYVTTRPDWVPLEFTLVPWSGQASTRCQVQLAIAEQANTAQEADVEIPAGGAMVWVVSGITTPGVLELVLLKEGANKPAERDAKDSSPDKEQAAAKERANQLVQTARAAFEAGNLDKAEAQLRQAITMDSRCQAAYYYLYKVMEARARSVAQPPIRLWDVSSNRPYAGPVRPDSSTTSTNLYTRVIKVEPKQFFSRLSQLGGKEDLNTPEAIIKAIRDLFLTKGIDLQPPSTFFLEDREGMLMVHATLQELDMIEQTLAEFSAPPAQINLKVQFAQVSRAMSESLWSDLGFVRVNGTNQSKILTPPQAAVFRRALEAKNGATILNEASVTTLSGRQTQVQCVDPRIIVTNHVTTQIPLGPAIDMVPSLANDGWRIGLTTVASLTELLGENEPSEPANPSSGSVPQIRRRQIAAAHYSVPDGYTLVLADAVDEEAELVEKLIKNDFGDRATLIKTLEARGISYEKYLQQLKERLRGFARERFVVLITPTLIDEKGTRLHSDAQIESLAR